MKFWFLSVITLLLAAASSACAEPAPTDAREDDAKPMELALAQSEAAGEMKGDVIQSAPRVAPQSMGEVHLSFAPIVEKTTPAVVNVFTRRTVQRTTGDPFFDRFWGVGPREQNSLGSGVIVSPDGVIVTNNHVVDGMEEIKIVFTDRREFPAKVLFTDKQTDLAILKIDVKEPLPFLEFANSDAIEVGDVVLAIGNPFGVGQTVTSGIVSALARPAGSVSDYQLFIQTDAAINPGNSGGALVDINGKLIGVNTAIYSRSGGSNGIGFAVPARLVQQVLSTALNGGELTRPWIGAATDTVTANVATAIGLDRPAGAIVTDIWAGGPAEDIGLKAGDVITSFDGQPVYDAATLRYRIGVHSDGDAGALVYIRDGKEKAASIRLKLPPDQPARDERKFEGANPLDGVTVDNLSPRFNEQVGLDPFRTGVAVTEIDRRSFAARRGLRPGYRILSVNGRKVSTTAELKREIDKAQGLWELEIDTGDRVVPWRVGR